MPRVKILANYGPQTPGGFPAHFAKQTKDGSRWNDLEIVAEGPCDYWVILNCPPGRNDWGTIGDCVVDFDPRRSIVFQAEPSSTVRRFPVPFNDPFQHRDQFLYVHDTEHHFNFIEWWLSHTYGELNEDLVVFSKDRELSAICSTQYALEGHKLRCDFLRYLSQRMSFDLITRDPKPWRKPWWNRIKVKTPRWSNPGWWYRINERNVNLIDGRNLTKDAGLTHYGYHIAVENSSQRNYFTEKIVDPILAECLCFYWGCPNLDDFIDPRAVIRLDLSDYPRSEAIIRDAVAANEREKRLPYIRAAKRKILNELQFLPELESTLHRSLGSCEATRDTQPAIQAA